MKNDKLVLAVSISGFQSVIEKAYDLPALAKHVDLFSVMAYDYHGFWDQQTGHHSPLSGAESRTAVRPQ
jgi:chitinase